MIETGPCVWEQRRRYLLRELVVYSTASPPVFITFKSVNTRSSEAGEWKLTISGGGELPGSWQSTSFTSTVHQPTHVASSVRITPRIQLIILRGWNGAHRGIPPRSGRRPPNLSSPWKFDSGGQGCVRGPESGAADSAVGLRDSRGKSGSDAGWMTLDASLSSGWQWPRGVCRGGRSPSTFHRGWKGWWVEDWAEAARRAYRVIRLSVLAPLPHETGGAPWRLCHVGGVRATATFPWHRSPRLPEAIGTEDGPAQLRSRRQTGTCPGRAEHASSGADQSPADLARLRLRDPSGENHP